MQDLPILTVWPAGFKYQMVLMAMDQDFMNRDEIKQDKNGQNMFSSGACSKHLPRGAWFKKPVDKLNSLGSC